MDEEPLKVYTSAPMQQPAPKKSHKGLKVVGLLLLIIALVAAAAYGVYAWKQGELTAQKKDFDSQLAAAKTSQKSADTKDKPIVGDRPGHELTPPKVGTDTTCNADELTLSLAQGDGGGAGTLNQMIVLTNSSKRTCILGGFPGVSLVNDNGNQIGAPAARASNYSEKKLTLKPGETMNDAFRKLSSVGLHVSNVRTNGSMLEEVFIQLIEKK